MILVLSRQTIDMQNQLQNSRILPVGPDRLQQLADVVGSFVAKELQEFRLDDIALKIIKRRSFFENDLARLLSVPLPVLAKLVEISTLDKGEVSAPRVFLHPVVYLDAEELCGDRDVDFAEILKRVKQDRSIFINIDDVFNALSARQVRELLVNLSSIIVNAPGDFQFGPVSACSFKTALLGLDDRQKRDLLWDVFKCGITVIKDDLPISELSTLAKEVGFSIALRQEITDEYFADRLWEVSQFDGLDFWIPSCVSEIQGVSVVGSNVLRAVALARIVLTRDVRIEVSAVDFGVKLAHAAVSFGASSFGMAPLLKEEGNLESTFSELCRVFETHNCIKRSIG